MTETEKFAIVDEMIRLLCQLEAITFPTAGELIAASRRLSQRRPVRRQRAHRRRSAGAENLFRPRDGDSGAGVFGGCVRLGEMAEADLVFCKERRVSAIRVEVPGSVD